MRRTRPSCAGCPALVRGLCGALDEAELQRLSSAAWHRKFRSGQVIHPEGEIPSSFCAVISGVVKYMKTLPNGSQQIVGLSGPGDFLGRPFGSETHSASVAASEVEVCWFPRSLIEGVTAQSSEAKSWFFEAVADDLEKAQDWIMLLGRMTAEQKVAAFLLSVARKAHPDGPLRPEMMIEIPISRTETADYLGLTIETVSRQIARLRERGVVTVRNTRHMVIHRPDALAASVENVMPAERAEALRA